MLSFVVFSVIFSGLLLYEVRNKTLILRMALLLWHYSWVELASRH